jgi:hypothetical protein
LNPKSDNLLKKQPNENTLRNDRRDAGGERGKSD